MMKFRIPLSKSASAFQTISLPSSPLSDTFTLKGGGGGVLSLVEPVFTYSIHAFATVSLGSQIASLGLPWKKAAGTAVVLSHFANQALLMSTGLRICVLLPLSGNRIAKQASKNGIAK